jgi:hypothetical protein
MKNGGLTTEGVSGGSPGSWKIALTFTETELPQICEAGLEIVKVTEAQAN